MFAARVWLKLRVDGCGGGVRGGEIRFKKQGPVKGGGERNGGEKRQRGGRRRAAAGNGGERIGLKFGKIG